MAKRERFKDEIPFKEMTAAQKRSYLWDYWRNPVIVTVLVAAVLVSIIYTMATRKEVLLAVTLVDTLDTDAMEPLAEEFAVRQGIPLDQLQVSNAVVGTEEAGGGAGSEQSIALYVRLQAGSEDILIMPEEAFLEFAAGGYFLDLTDVVSDEWQDKIILAERFYDEYDEVQPDPVPCGIHVSDIPGMPDSSYYQNAVIAVSCLPANYDNAAAFLNYLLEL